MTVYGWYQLLSGEEVKIPGSSLYSCIHRWSRIGIDTTEKKNQLFSKCNTLIIPMGTNTLPVVI